MQIAVIAATISAALVTVGYKAKSGFWFGFQDRIAAAGGANSLAEFGPEHAGYIAGAGSVALPFLGLTLWAIAARRFLPALVSTALLVMAGLAQGSFPLISIVVVILILTGSGRTWLKKADPLNGAPPPAA